MKYGGDFLPHHTDYNIVSYQQIPHVMSGTEYGHMKLRYRL